MFCLEVIKKLNNEAQAEYDKKVKARMGEVDAILHFGREHSARSAATIYKQRGMFLDLIKNIIAND